MGGVIYCALGETVMRGFVFQLLEIFSRVRFCIEGGEFTKSFK